MYRLRALLLLALFPLTGCPYLILAKVVEVDGCPGGCPDGTWCTYVGRMGDRAVHLCK